MKKNHVNIHTVNPLYMSIYEAAKYKKCSLQSLYIAIQKGRLNAVKIKNKWKVTKDILKEYKKDLYSRKHSKFLGEAVYDEEKGEYSIKEAAKIMQRNYSKVYTLIRYRKIPAKRKGYAWVLDINDLNKYLEFEKEKLLNQKKRIAHG